MGSNTNSQISPPLHIAEALSAIRRFVRVLRMSDAATERTTGISSAQLLVLQLLAESEANSVNYLAERTMTDQSSVSVVVARLVAKGLASRTPSSADARRTTVSITPNGRALLPYAPPSLQERLVAALQQMPPATLGTFTQELSQIVALMGAHDQPPTFLFEDDATGYPS